MKDRNTKYLFDEEKMTSDGMVSVSQLQVFMSCPKKWAYSYVENLTPRIDRAYLTIGKLCHKGMQIAMQTAWKDQQLHLCEDYCTTGRWMDWMNAGVDAIKQSWVAYMDETPVLAEEIPEFNQMVEDALKVFKQAYTEFEPWKYRVFTLTKNGKPIPALELHFAVPCTGSKGLHGYIDAILTEIETGHIWCTDYKFRKSLSPDEEEALNIQNAVYTYACTKMKIPITGTMTWQHCNTPAADPQLLKTGGVSKAKIKTTWEHYAQFCVDNGIDPAPYAEEMQEKLEDIEWYKATHEYRNLDTVSNMWCQVVVPASQAIRKARGSKTGQYARSLYPWNCKMCQFKDLCQAELRNYDANFLREVEYTTRTSNNHIK